MPASSPQFDPVAFLSGVEAIGPCPGFLDKPDWTSEGCFGAREVGGMWCITGSARLTTGSLAIGRLTVYTCRKKEYLISAGRGRRKSPVVSRRMGCAASAGRGARQGNARMCRPAAPIMDWGGCARLGTGMDRVQKKKRSNVWFNFERPRIGEDGNCQQKSRV